MAFGWKNGIVKALLLGTMDPGSALWILAGQQNILYHIFSFWAEVLVCLGGISCCCSCSLCALATVLLQCWPLVCV